ncbi:MAG: sulfotransferase family 2 domain-containing protein, partial [Xanthomonadales bacterium]|nr:sulfotransferase family 2 domain-containing protein [Xanthomonadales bacterium]
DCGAGEHEATLERYKLHVRALSQSFITRHVTAGASVFHPYLKGGMDQKIETLDEGIHFLRQSAGLKLSYNRRKPVPKTGRSLRRFTHGYSKVLGFGLPCRFTRKVLFIHIPKAGGTSVQDRLDLKGRGHLRYADIQNFGEYYSFTITRNPFSRLVSAFHYLTDRERLPIWDHEESDYVAAYAQDFRRFVVEVVASFDIYRSIHLIPQSFFVCDGDRIMVHEVVSLEHIEEEMLSIQRRFGRIDGTPHLNRSQHLTTDSYYDDETRAIVREVYRLDFQRFNYDPQGAVDAAPLTKPEGYLRPAWRLL